MILSVENSRLFWRQANTSVSDSKIEWPSDHLVNVLCQTSGSCPESEPPITLRAIGNPPQPLTICNSRNQIKSVIVYKFNGNIGQDFSFLNHTAEIWKCRFFFFLFSFPCLHSSSGDSRFARNKINKLKCMCKYENMILAGIYQHKIKCIYWQSTFSISSSGM